jgi:hypothetical protein
MSTSTIAPAAPRAHAVPVPDAVLAHRRAVVRWALSSGRAAHRDALAAIVAARAQSAGLGLPGAASVWTVEDIGTLLWVDLSEWCQDAEVELPEQHQVAATLDTYLRYLSAHRLLATGSDAVAALRRAIADYGGGRSRSHPSMRQHAAAPVVPLARG